MVLTRRRGLKNVTKAAKLCGHLRCFSYSGVSTPLEVTVWRGNRRRQQALPSRALHQEHVSATVIRRVVVWYLSSRKSQKSESLYQAKNPHF